MLSLDPNNSVDPINSYKCDGLTEDWTNDSDEWFLLSELYMKGVWV